MIGYATAAAALLLLVAQPAKADRWVFVNDSGGVKLGFQEAGSNSFDTLWLQCDGPGRLIAASAAYGSRRARGEVSARVSGAGRNTTLFGYLGEEFDGIYWIEAKVSRDDPLFDILRSGQPVSYRAPGWIRPRLPTAGQRSATERFLAACP